MRDNENMKYSFILQDLDTNKRIFLDSVTDLGKPGDETYISIRKDDVKIRHHVTVLERKTINQVHTKL